MVIKDIADRGFFRTTILFLGLFLFTLIVNYGIILLSPIFPEQPPLYLANQQIHSFSDLLNVYLEPRMFYAGSIPYFRPSGHFLIYQLITPFIGWHNLTALMLINFMFLALTGVMIIKLYQVLFPGYKAGAYIAFAIFMTHPALVLSRYMMMQFDYSYAFFSLLSLYLFILFCRKNVARQQLYFQSNLSLTQPSGKVEFNSLAYFIGSLFFYAVAITFKEIAIMLGPVLMVYFLLVFYKQNAGNNFSKWVFGNKQVYQLMLVLTLFSAFLACYLSFQWLLAKRYFGGVGVPTALVYYGHVLAGFWGNYYSPIFDSGKGLLFSFFTQAFWWLGWMAVILSAYLLRSATVTSSTVREFKTSFLFLFIAAGIFLILPFFLGGFPWHLVMTILFLSFLMGFSMEYVGRQYLTLKWVNLLTLFLILGIAVDAIYVNSLHSAGSKKSYAFVLNRNAILHPPFPRQKINAESVVVIEDSGVLNTFIKLGMNVSMRQLNQQNNAYLFGDGFYPFTSEKNIERARKGYFLKPQYIYNGMLFRWAYLMPDLKEEIYPFSLQAIDKVPDNVIYNWLQHIDNIFLATYDADANWHDSSAEFRTNLLKEKSRRHMVANPYWPLNNQIIEGKSLGAETIPMPIPQLCQQKCDKQKTCDGVVFTIFPYAGEPLYICEYIANIDVKKTKACSLCSSFIKKKTTS